MYIIVNEWFKDFLLPRKRYCRRARLRKFNFWCELEPTAAKSDSKFKYRGVYDPAAVVNCESKAINGGRLPSAGPT